MKFLVITVALLAGISTATCYVSSGRDNSYQGSDSSSKYLQYLKERSQLEELRTKFEAICPGKSDELNEAVLEMKKCTDSISEDTETLCSAMKNHFLRCSKPMIQAFEKCLPEESKEVPNLIFQATNSGVGYFCKTDGEHIFELANSCIFKTSFRSIRCERRMKTKLQQYRNKSPSKSDICEFANSMKPCLQSHLQDSCGNHITRESFMGVFDAVTAPCKTVTDNQIEFNHISEEVEVL